MEKNIIALDLGKGSLGLAISRSGMLVTPLPNLRFHAMDYEECLRLFKKAIENERIEHVVIGWPLFPSGDPCEMTPIVEDFTKMIEPLFPGIEIHKVDERNSTVEAASMLHGVNQNSRKQRSHIDSAAAMIILERYLKSIGQD